MASCLQLAEKMRQLDIYDKIPYTEEILDRLNRDGLPDRQETDALRTFFSEEIDRLADALPGLTAYRDKKDALDYADLIAAVQLMLYGSWNRMPEDLYGRFDGLADLLEELCPIEATADRIFGQEQLESGYIDRLLSYARGTDDEYEKGSLYYKLLQYRDRLRDIPPEGLDTIAVYLSGELDRYLRTETPDDDMLDALEGAADLCRYLPAGQLGTRITAVLETVRDSAVLYYAAETAILYGLSVPEAAIRFLAEDPVYADSTYRMLQRYGCGTAFPEAYASSRYLARSSLIRWLSDPEVLGEEPEEIEYLGRVTFRFPRRAYEVFRFRSESPALIRSLRGVWLVGWADDGRRHTGSRFGEYAPCERETAEKTLKVIKRKFLGLQGLFF